MKRIGYLLLIVSSSIYAQEIDTLQVDTVKKVPKHLIGVQASLGVNWSPNPQGLDLTNVYSIGFRYDRFSIGWNVFFFGGENREQLIFPNWFDLDYAHGGGYLTYVIHASENMEIALLGSFSAGDMVWELSDTNEDFFREKINFFRFGTEVEYPALKYVRPSVQLGYQTMSEIGLPGLTSDDFTGFFVGFNVKVGYFNQ